MNCKVQSKEKKKYLKLDVQQQLAVRGGKVPDDKPKRPKVLRPTR